MDAHFRGPSFRQPVGKEESDELNFATRKRSVADDWNWPFASNSKVRFLATRFR
jgi:hypothetical protein